MFISINQNLLDKFANKYNLKRGIEACNICRTAQSVINKVFSNGGKSFKVIFFKSGILAVKVSNSILLQELKFRESQIIDLILDKTEGIKLEKIIGRIN